MKVQWQVTIKLLSVACALGVSGGASGAGGAVNITGTNTAAAVFEPARLLGSPA